MIMIAGLYPYANWDFFRTQLLIGIKVLIGLHERKNLKNSYAIEGLFEEESINEPEIEEKEIEEEIVEEKPVAKKKKVAKKKTANSKKKTTKKKKITKK